jgi:hypothetical protein
VNAQLQLMMNFQTASSATHGQNTLTITDKVRGDVVVAQQVAFKRYPDLTFAKDAGVNEWVFEAVTIDRALGE